jgi:hypothetical protein
MPSVSTIVSILVCLGVVLALTRRPITSVIVTLYLLGVIFLSSAVKLTHLGLALTLADVHFFLLRPIENFKLFFQYPLLGLLLLASMFGAILCIWVGVRFERPLRHLATPRMGPWLRITTGTLSILLAVIASWVAAPQSQARVNNGDSYVAFLVMYESQHPSGVMGVLNLFFNNRSFEASVPPPVGQKRFPIPNETGAASIDASQTRPDIFLILEESTFDPTLILKCPATFCDQAMLHPLQAAMRTRQGPLLVHTTGGGTWLAEFAVMSGLDWRLFGRGGAFAPVSLAPRLHNALPQYLRSLGYRTVAVYPTAGNFLSARNAYEHYGFDEFYDADDLHLPNEWSDTRDAMVFDKALALAHSDTDLRPVFVFVLTIRNHGPHGPPKSEVPAAFLPAARATNGELGDFLARMHDSSDDFVTLANNWLHSSRPRVLAWFGDHQPEAAWDFTEHPQLLNMKRIATNVPKEQLTYLTHYQFSSNFGERAQNIERDAMDIAYLGENLLAFAGVPLDAGMTVARSVEAQCNGLMFDCADRQLLADYLDFRIHGLRSIQ